MTYRIPSHPQGSFSTPGSEQLMSCSIPDCRHSQNLPSEEASMGKREPKKNKWGTFENKPQLLYPPLSQGTSPNDPPAILLNLARG